MFRFTSNRIVRAAFALIFLTAFSTAALGYVVNPDLTGAGVIAALKSDPGYSSRPYSETYNLGATGLRGWIYIDSADAGADGLITAPSRQILVTVASAPASAVLAVDDVILGAMAASTGTVPAFTSDCRKAFGVAIGDAEKSGAGTLRVKRWRAGVTTDVNIPMTIMGNYTTTAPYTCPKSALILANARIKLVSDLKADPNFLGYSYGGAISGLALLASVAPGDADYAIVQTRLKSFADALAGNGMGTWGQETWSWSYMSIFLSEYYLRTVADGAPDASILAGISRYTVAIAKGQSRYGTFGHGGTPAKPDGSLHGTVPPYGPLNAAGIPANVAIVIGKKALVAGGQTIDPEIDPAIQRGSDFFSYYMNKGGIPYGEHEPVSTAHASNGKDPMCAVLFGLQDTRPAEAEYFARMSVAGCTGREYGHTGQGLSYLWGAMGANMGGPTAIAKYMENIRWHLDLVRRTDGSFSYDGQEQYGGGSTADGSYLGKCGYNDINPTATFILSYSVSLQRLYITGRNAIPANTLSLAKVSNAIAAATYKQDCSAYTTTQLLADLSAYDPVVRNYAAIELATRTLTTTELNNLIASITNGTMSSAPSTRMGACQALGARQATGALTALGQRLSDTDLWVRGKAAQALRIYGAGANGQRDTMLTAFAANATDPEVIVWNDPVQIANNYLSFALFGDSVYGGGNIISSTINAAKNLLYPAVKAGLKQPDSNPRLGVANFAQYYLTLADAQALTPDLFAAATSEALADTMWHGEARAAGIQAVANYKPFEAIPIALSMMEVPPNYGWGAQHFQIAALNVLSSFGDSARWTLPALRQYALSWDTASPQFPVLNSTIASIEAAISSPAGMINLVAVATPQVVVTPVSTAKAITLTGTSPRGAVTFSNVTTPIHGTLTGTAPNLIYTPAAGYTGPDYFTFKVADTLTTSETGTVSIIMGTAGTGLKGEYFDNTNFTNLKLTRIDPEVNFDWGTGSPDPSVGADTFSVRWSGQLLIPETGSYTFSTLNSDGARMFINGVSVINDYVDHSTSWKDGTPISLTAGQRVELQMEYYENTGSAVAKLKWSGPTLAGINGSIIAKEWLYDGTGITNRTPYAHAQSVTLVQNTAQAITLTGSGAAQTPLTYSVITQPAHGTLTGAAPNLTYTPAANYSGSDSFTFLVNNGYTNSYPATVSIGIWSGSPTSYFWTNAVAGNWSGAFWSNATGGAVTPAVAGNSSYSLNFNMSGTYTTTQDLNNNYVFNQLNLAGNVTFDGTNSLSPTGNGSLLPQINQNSASAVIINTPINLAAMTTFGGVGGGPIYMTGVFSGPGGVNKDGPGTLQIHGLSPNPYSGGTIVNGGTLHLGAFVNGESIDCVNPVGTGPVTLNSGGTIQFDRVSTNNALIANGGTLFSGNGWGAAWSGAITLNATVTVNAPYALNCSGAISGAGGFTKVEVGPLILSGNNSFTGANQITAGTLQCNTASSLGTGPLNITTGANVYLNYTGSRTIAALSYNGGAPLAPGTYGSTSSPATNKNNTYFSGTGTITILPASSTALSLSSGSTPSNVGAPLTFTATVTGTSPTGNVAFYAGATLLGSGTLNGSFQASFTTSSLAVGSYSITAKYAGNASNAASTSSALTIQITSLLPAQPANLVGVRGMNSASVGLTWTVSAGATGYNVKRALTNGGPYTTIGTSVGANYNDLTALGATRYYYIVSATNASGESANSASASVMPYVPSSTKVILTFVFPGLPAASISETSISVTLPFGTSVTALAPTYTVSANATGSPVSGTSRNFSTPQTYTITAEDNSTKVYTVTVTVLPDSVPPVTSGLVLRMDASKITGTANGAQLNTWADTSGAANNAIRQSGSSAGYPMYVTGVLNGNPVVRFNSGNTTGDNFKFTRISTIQTVFWVLKENASLSDGRFLLGDDTTYQFHRKSANGPLWDNGYAASNIKNGTTKLMGNVIDGTTTSLPSGSFQVVSLVTTGNVQANSICQDRTSHGSWQGDIAEILIYNRALTAAEELQVGSYLSAKYALSTAYPTAPTGVSATPASSGAISVSWLDVPGATSYSVSYKTTVGGTEQVVTGLSASPTIVSGLANGTSYDFKVSATNASGTSAYSSIVSATPSGSSAKDILTFDLLGQPATISDTSISIVLPFGTNVTALAPTYTVSANATGSPVSGTPRNFTTPKTYTITAEDNSTKIYTVTVALMPDSIPPVTSGLVLRMDASKITGIANGAQLNTWADTSGAANNAIRQSGSSAGYPMYVTGALNGNPVVRFNSGNAIGDSFKFTRISTIQTVFWVLKENAGVSDGRFLLGDDSTYQFHRNTANGPLWDGSYADSNIKNGTTRLMGNVINGTTTSLPSGSFQVVSLVTTGNVQANSICQDRTDHGSWQGDIAEILIYNRALTGAEELQVGGYLSAKYALSTAYPVTPTGVSATPASPGAISVSWLDVPGATSYSVSYKTTVGGTEQVVTGVSASPYIVSGLTNGTSYDFKVAATNAAGTSAYSSMVSATPSGSSAKDILTFVFPGLPATTISGTSISVTVPYGTVVTGLAPTFTQSPLATVAPVSATARNFTTALTYTVTAQDLTTQVYTVTVTVAPSPFSTWASNPAQGLTAGVNDSALADPDRDGISNLLEFALGGAPMVSLRTILPTLTPSGNNWLFEYNRSDLSLSPATTQVVEYGSDLAGWTMVTIPTTTAGIVTIAPGSPSDHVTVTIPSPGAKGFVRLKVTQ